MEYVSSTPESGPVGGMLWESGVDPQQPLQAVGFAFVRNLGNGSSELPARLNAIVL
jgi:hypothetical protein